MLIAKLLFFAGCAVLLFGSIIGIYLYNIADDDLGKADAPLFFILSLIPMGILWGTALLSYLFAKIF